MNEIEKQFEIDEDNLSMITSRTIKAPTELVYDLFTNAEQVDKWYGPKGCHITTSEMVVKEGGSWNYTMHLPNGNTFDAFHTYTEVTKNEKLVFISASTPNAPNDEWFTTKILFNSKGNDTEVKIVMSYKTKTMFNKAKEFGSIRGYVSALEKLENFLSST